MNTKYLSSLSLFRLFIIFTTINNTFFSNIQQYLSHLVFCQKLMIHSSLITWMKSYLLPIKSIMVALFIYKLRKKNLFQKFPRIIWLLHQQKPSSNVKEITWMKSYNTFFFFWLHNVRNFPSWTRIWKATVTAYYKLKWPQNKYYHVA